MTANTERALTTFRRYIAYNLVAKSPQWSLDIAAKKPIYMLDDAMFECMPICTIGNTSCVMYGKDHPSGKIIPGLDAIIDEHDIPRRVETTWHEIWKDAYRNTEKVCDAINGIAIRGIACSPETNSWVWVVLIRPLNKKAKAMHKMVRRLANGVPYTSIDELRPDN